MFEFNMYHDGLLCKLKDVDWPPSVRKADDVLFATYDYHKVRCDVYLSSVPVTFLVYLIETGFTLYGFRGGGHQDVPMRIWVISIDEEHDAMGFGRLSTKKEKGCIGGMGFGTVGINFTSMRNRLRFVTAFDKNIHLCGY